MAGSLDSERPDMGNAGEGGQRGRRGHLLAERRRAGVLCPLSALPVDCSPLFFLDWLASAGIQIWQVLPFNPPDAYGSPYSSASLNAGDVRLLAEWPQATADDSVRRASSATLTDAAPILDDAPGSWLHDYALFEVARSVHGAPWCAWPEALRDREPAALAAFALAHASAMATLIAGQRAFFTRLARLRAAAHERGILLFGDMALYPAFDSVDVWTHRALFELDAAGRPTRVAGVPPDYFSVTGQLWGNPVYDWPAHEASAFSWWKARIAHQLQWLDVLRIDHFRGLQAAWCIPADASTAVDGEWRTAPGAALLSSLDDATRAALVAEDLGVITPEVTNLREQFGLPGMRVLQFGFSGDAANPHHPSNIEAEQVLYTGTHDNDTSLGWYLQLDAHTRALVDRALADPAFAVPAQLDAARAKAARAGSFSPSFFAWSFMASAVACAANTVVLPLQDVLALGSAARMNTPGVATGNWHWQCDTRALTTQRAKQLRVLLQGAGRT